MYFFPSYGLGHQNTPCICCGSGSPWSHFRSHCGSTSQTVCLPLSETNKVLFVFFFFEKKREAAASAAAAAMGDVMSGPMQKKATVMIRFTVSSLGWTSGLPPSPVSPPPALMTTSKTLQAKQGQTETSEPPPPPPPPSPPPPPPLALYEFAVGLKEIDLGKRTTNYSLVSCFYKAEWGEKWRDVR